MHLYIKNIILYPKNKEKSPRFITFIEDKINIITGTSQKGKSAIINIIDYCLGSGDCNIPIGLIRDTTEVFALYVKINEDFYFIGRENYDEHKSKMYFYKESSDKNIELRNNAWLYNKNDYSINLNYFKSFINNIAGFKNVGTENSDNNSFNIPASFRDTAAFQFQTQNIIANPTTMFYKSDSWEHLQKLKTIFPLILGYKSYEIIDLENKIIEKEKEKNKKITKFEQIKTQYEDWQSDIYKYYTEAVTIGLSKSDISIKSSSVDEIKNELSNIIKDVNSGTFYKDGTANRFSEKLNNLNNQRNLIIRQLDDLRYKYNKVIQIDDSKELYFDDVVKEKELRLRPIEWFLDRKGKSQCPFCGSNSDKAINELLHLNQERQKNIETLAKLTSNELSFDKEKKELKNEIKFRENQVNEIDKNLNILLSEEKQNSNSVKRVYEFIGKIEHVVENLNRISPSGELEIEIELLEQSIAKDRLILNKLKKKFDKENSLNKLNNLISNYIKLLPIEDNNKRRVLFDPSESLVIKIEDINTKNKYFLSRIGSGANYMGYHLATIFGLHEYFFKLNETGKVNFIPSFLILDQPSQVYYPKEFTKDSKDIEDTRKIFTTSFEFMKKTDFKIQLIILEHVPKELWEDIDDTNFNLVAEWDNNSEALIPNDWY
ncbi:DUF3732 domain-containing protein [Empedobacter sp. UBA5987]|uniref:DUF3732 domain-containing protein n=1 Tax=Empedobacter sp. UBA5987 TaxID=1946444 RepID=UPI0025C3BBEF|nr:DUF3732 domain-containing protein [Empedobacter sp. UBA5987]